MRSFLFLMRRSPYDGIWAQECIDQLLTTAAFDQRVRVLFLDDGVFQLLSEQESHVGGRKTVASLLKALPLYDVEDIFVETESLQERGVSPGRLLLPAEPVLRAQIPALLDAAEVLIGC